MEPQIKIAQRALNLQGERRRAVARRGDDPSEMFMRYRPAAAAYCSGPTLDHRFIPVNAITVDASNSRTLMLQAFGGSLSKN